ncbi:MAG: hypothetical protein OXC09_09075 [Truepera sp.]|nr:hypothetical protein [Truepera sp.]
MSRVVAAAASEALECTQPAIIAFTTDRGDLTGNRNLEERCLTSYDLEATATVCAPPRRVCRSPSGSRCSRLRLLPPLWCSSLADRGRWWETRSP